MLDVFIADTAKCLVDDGRALPATYLTVASSQLSQVKHTLSRYRQALTVRANLSAKERSVTTKNDSEVSETRPLESGGSHQRFRSMTGWSPERKPFRQRRQSSFIRAMRRHSVV